MRGKNRAAKVLTFFLFVFVILIGSFVAFSDTFEKEAPQIKIKDTIYWNTRDKLSLSIVDNVAIKNIKVEFSKNDENEKKILLNNNLNSKEANVELELPKPKFNEKIDKYTLYISSSDISFWNWFRGNSSFKKVDVLIDNKRPTISILANSYNITKGGAASVVFYANDDNLTDLYIEANSRKFKASPYLKDNYYVALLAWDIKDDNFEASIVAKDLANNISKERIPYYITNKSYRVSKINVNDKFIDGKIKDLYEINSDNSLNDRALIFDYVNATLRGKNEELIHKITSEVSDELISDFYLHPFLPLKNGMKVADYGDRRFYQYQGKQISESYHMGLDLASTRMAPIVLSNKGKIVFAQDNGIYGLNIIVDHGLGLYTLYGHCTKKNVEIDDLVNAKTAIANTGTTGLALGDHLHFGVLVQGIEIRPEEWMDSNWMKLNIFDILKKAKSIIEKK